jgi:alkanesulfonate monooxygenase SsuD/methylene tetrahydromethanopterin reductase-like flavin-dependent oxidoreductase (luciferase family)
VAGWTSGSARAVAAPDELAAVVRREFDAYGVPIVPAGEAVGALAEACTLIRRMWAEDEQFDFTGRYYQLRGAVCEPKPVQRPHPPFMLGAGGERAALRVVAEHADIWNCPARTAEEFRHKSRVLDEHCAAAGRDPAGITRSMQVLVRPGDLAASQALLLELIDAGATHLVLAPVPPWPDRPAQWLADEVAAPVAAQLASAT